MQDEDEEADLELEGQDFVEGESLDSLVLEEQVESVVLDEEALAAIEAAQGFITAYNDELVVEAEMGGDELSSADAVAAKAAVAVLAGFGPVWAAQAVQAYKGKSADLFADSMGEENVSAGSDKGARVLGIHPATFHVAVGTLFCSVPVTWMCWLAL